MKTLLKLAFITTCLALLASCGEEKDSPSPDDTTSPTISSVSPNDGATDVSVMTSITVRFSESIDASTVSRGTLGLSAGTVTVSGTFEVTSSSVVFTPSSALNYGTEYTISITSEIKDEAGNGLSGSSTSTFTTEDEPDTEAPTIISTVPSNGAMNVGIGADLEITFSEEIDINSVDDNSLKLTVFGVPDLLEASVSIDGSVLTVDPTLDFEGNTAYNLSFSQGGIKDLVGNGLASDFEIDFTTEVIDNESPSILGFSVSNGETGVDANGGITINFSEPMDPNSFDGSILFRRGGTTNHLPISFEVNGNDVTVTPEDGMKGNTEYVLDVTVNVKDLAGNQLDFARGRVFKTAEVPLTILSMTPQDDALDVEVDEVITITFSEPIEESTVSVFWAGGGPSITTSVDGAVLTVTPTGGFTEFETDYLLQISSSIEDINGNSLTSNEFLSFTTVFVSERYYYFIRNYQTSLDGNDSYLAFQETSPQVTYWSGGSSNTRLWRFINNENGYLIRNFFLEDNNFSDQNLFSFPLTSDNKLAYSNTVSTGTLWTFDTPTNGVRTMRSRGNLFDGQNLTMTSDQGTSSGYRWWIFSRQPISVD